MIEISLVTPFRERLEDLNNLFESLRKTTEEPKRVEVVLIIDRCDKVVFPIMRELEEKYKDFNLRCIDRERSDHFTKDYYAYAAKRAKGRWIMAINDDSLFMTPGWDTVLLEKMNTAADEFGDDILFGVVFDGMTQGRTKTEMASPSMSCWPLVSKEYVNFTGTLVPTEIYSWGADYWIGKIFKELFRGRRVVKMPEILVDHNSAHNQKEGKEPTPNFANFQRIEAENHAQIDDKVAMKYTKELQSYCNYQNRKRQGFIPEKYKDERYEKKNLSE